MPSRSRPAPEPSLSISDRAVTRQVGGTINFTVPSGTINTTQLGVNGIIPGAIWNGSDLVGANGTALSKYAGYTPLSGTSIAPTISSATATNIKVDGTTSNNVTLPAVATTSINTLTYADTSDRTIDVRNGATLETLNFGIVGTILDGANGGNLTIGVSGTAGTLTAGGTTANTAGELIFVNNSANMLTVNSAITNNGSGAATIVKSGSGVVTLAGTNTFTGSIYVNSGALAFSDGGLGKNLGNATVGTSDILMNGGALRYLGTGNNTLALGVTFNGISAIDVPNTTGTNALTMGTTTLSSSDIGIAGVVGILQKTGAGTLTFGGNQDDASLSVEVVGGTLNLGKSSSSGAHSVSGGNAAAALVIDSGAVARITGTGNDQIYDGSSVLIKTGGTLDLGGGTSASESFDGLAGAGTVTNSALAGTFTLTLGAAANSEGNISANTLAAANAGVASTGLKNFFGVIQDGGTGKLVALTKGGGGTQILSGQSTYSGATTINAGTLKFGVTNALPSGVGKGDVTISGSTVVNGLIVPGTLDLSSFDQTINALNSTTGGFVTNTIPLVWGGGSWSATTGTNTLTIGANGDSGAFNGIFQNGFTVVSNPGTGSASSASGILALTKTGVGIETLSGANTATGALTVNQGEVDLNTTGTSAWSGNVFINPTGTVKLLQSQQIANAATLTVSGGVFELNGHTETVGGVSLTTNSTHSGHANRRRADQHDRFRSPIRHGQRLS